MRIFDHTARIALLAIIIVVTWTNISLKFWKEGDRVLVWDVKAYYTYLPAVFIYRDLSLRFAEKRPEKFGAEIYIVKTPIGVNYIQSTYGLAFIYSPFFLVTHAIVTLTGGDASGYSPPYKIGLIVSCIFYLVLGLYFLEKFLLKYFSQWVTAITLVAIVLGTNLFYYSTYEGPMPHVYNFALIAAFLYFTDIWYEKVTVWKTIIFAFLVGLIALIRPVNLIIILFFVLWRVNSWDSLRDRILFLLRSYKWILLMILVFFIVWIPQFLYWKYISESYLFYSYSGQRFYFNNPQILSSLFSYRKGLLLYIPLMTFAYAGIPFLYRRFRGFILPVALFALINVYVLSSWCFWWFGGSFGPRSYIDTYAILAIPFAALTSWVMQGRWVKKAIFLFIVTILISFNFFQTRQYYWGTINWSGMTKEAYWDSFLKEYPSAEFNSLLRFPNRENALKGIYYKDDLTYEEATTSYINNMKIKSVEKMVDREYYIKRFDRTVRHYDEWIDEIEKRAASEGIPVDTLIRRDAILYYEKEMREKMKAVPDSL
jgi:predicted DNA binding CopG/RHH family protein